MSYTVEIVRREAQSTSTWSGGTTTQLAIFPETSDYKARDFLWRLSSALVEIEESIFTSLPGIYRHIMIIEGEMTLLHEGHHSILLKPFMQDSFSGGWTTRSIGRARDFNLMLNQGCKGELEAVSLEEGKIINVVPVTAEKGCARITQGFYCAAGSSELHIKVVEKYTLNEGDFVMVNYTSEEQGIDIRLQGISSGEAAVIRAGISY